MKYTLIHLTGKFIAIAGILFIAGYPYTGFARQEPTPMPERVTLTLDEWKILLQPTEECALPCWMGIHPGETPDDEAYQTVNEYIEKMTGRDLSAYSGLDDIHFDVALPGGRTRTMMILIAGATDNGDMANHMGITSAYLYEPYNPSILAWEHFSITSILETYGTPDNIRLLATRDDGGELYVDFIFFYWQDIGMVVHYYLRSTRNGVYSWYLPRCFNLQDIEAIEIWFQPAESSRPVETIETLGAEWMSYPLSEISDLSNEEFVEIILENDGCIPNNTPLEWEPGE